MQRAGGDDVGEVGFKLRDRPRRPCVGPAAKRVLPLQLQEHADLVQDGGDLVLIHRRRQHIRGSGVRAQKSAYRASRVTKQKTRRRTFACGLGSFDSRLLTPGLTPPPDTPPPSGWDEARLPVR